MKLLILTLLLSSCSYFERNNKPHENESNEAIKSKMDFYCVEGRKSYEARGFFDDRCDSLLFSSLWSVACGPIDMSFWENPKKPGQWHRNPERDCFLNGVPNGSASTISRDMFLGLFHHFWSTKDFQNIREIKEYGQANNWVMGEAKDSETLISRCVLTPQLIFTLKEMDAKLSGGTTLHPVSFQQDSADAMPLNTGFRAHLDILRILLNGRVYGSITDSEKNLLKAQAERQPMNALYVAASEKYNGGSKAIGLLLDETHFPESRLPNNHENHCKSYLHSGDFEDDTDWKICPSEPLRVFDGVDFVFAAWVFLDGR